MSERVCLGVITGARGLQGDLWVKSFTQDPADLGAYGKLTDEAGTTRWKLKVRDVVKGKVVARIEGVHDRTEAERLKGEKLYVDRAKLPEPEEEEYYYADLIGLTVELTDGERLGEVRAVHDFGAGDVLDVAVDGAKGVFLPFTREAVPVVDVKAGRLVVDPPPGLLEPPGETPGETDGDGEET